MAKEGKRKEKSNKMTSGRKGLCVSVISLAVVITLIAGFSRAWFVQDMNLATLMPVTNPSDIAILGPDGETLDSLELEYDEKRGDTKTTDETTNTTTVTMKRAICVRSAAEAHRLEIVHTTNLKGLEFKLYPVTSVDGKNTDTGNGSTSTDPTITDGNIVFGYKANALNGTYINKADTTDSSYKYAVDNSNNNSKHEKNYGDYNNVQSHAEPIYWLTDESLTADLQNDVEVEVTENGQTVKKNNHRTYYVCEISWTETTKETDIFYILAETADTTGTDSTTN